MATHSSTLAWKILWTEKPDRLQSMGLQELETTQQLKLKPPILLVTNQHIIDFVVLFFWGGWSRKIISKLSSECQAAFRCRCYAQRTIYGDLGSKESKYLVKPRSRKDAWIQKRWRPRTSQRRKKHYHLRLQILCIMLQHHNLWEELLKDQQICPRSLLIKVLTNQTNHTYN